MRGKEARPAVTLPSSAERLPEAARFHVDLFLMDTKAFLGTIWFRGSGPTSR